MYNSDYYNSNYDFITSMDARYSGKNDFVVFEQCSSGLIQILDITKDFKRAYGSAYYHIFCVEGYAGKPYVVEGEDGICIPYSDTEDNPKYDNYVFIIKYDKED